MRRLTVRGLTVRGLTFRGATVRGPTIMGLTVPVRPIPARPGARRMIPALASTTTAETLAFLAGNAATTMPRWLTR